MPSMKRAKRGSSRRFFWLTTLIVLAILAYSGGWFYTAGLLEARTAALFGRLNSTERRAHCEEPRARGYPFRIGVFCRSVFYEDAADGISVSAGAFRSAAQIYQPMRVVGELDGPASITLPHVPALKAEWELMQMSARLTSKIPQRVSTEAAKIAISLDSDEATPVATAETLQTHTRQNGADVDVALIMEHLSLAAEVTDGIALPALSGEMLVTIDDGVALLAEDDPNWRGRSGRIQSLSLKAADREASIALSGPVEIGNDGLINAQLQVTLNEPSEIAALATQAFPEQRDEIRAVLAGITSLGDSAIPVNIRRGRVFLGFIPVGEIPPVQ